MNRPYNAGQEMLSVMGAKCEKVRARGIVIIMGHPQRLSDG